ncbi:hypothetical protein DMA15_03660 [Streptomyces sp. WAC 01529]|nr:hypothetical protein DMA15_03660 [Streptomyces sp. WAC 01529]
MKDSQGDLVLREHFTVGVKQGYKLIPCRGGQSAPGAPADDSGDWSWVAPGKEAGHSLSEFDEAGRGAFAQVDFMPVETSPGGACDATDISCICHRRGCDGTHRCSCGRRWTGESGTGSYLWVRPVWGGGS